MVQRAPSPPRPAGNACLALLGHRVRQIRARRGMSRRILAAASGVSERYLAQLEAGTGNASITLLNAVADAMHVALDDLVEQREHQSTDYLLLRDRLRNADDAELRSILGALRGKRALTDEVRHVALVGLRGAGKSTLGQALAKQLGLPFVELVQEIERTAGMAVSDILARGGQSAYRRYEHAALDATLSRFEHAVIATGGSLVSQPETYDLLLDACYTVWLTASPAEHMARVVAQGDQRPMADSRHAMADLKRILEERAALYARADQTVDTSGQDLATSLAALLELDAVSRLVAQPAPASAPPAPPAISLAE